MSQSGRTFVGFGFGPIQSGLFLYEAYRSGNFDGYVIAEVDAPLVDAVQATGGRYRINIAHPNHIQQVAVEGMRLCHPARPQDRQELVQAIAAADELATALPSVRFYDSGDRNSVVSLLADGLALRDPDRPAILYAAENHNHAAELLADALRERVPARSLAKIQTLNTVVGKMSGVVTDVDTIARLGLVPLTPDTPRAVLVERFNHILISRVTLDGFQRGIRVFVEKDDLLPFEEAKLYGHNAIHALIGFLAKRRGLTSMDQAAEHEDILATARAAFLDESGAALIKKYGHLNEPLFTEAGYRASAEDLLQRMFNPHLNDLVARVTRDARRKLAYDDRLFGTMRLVLNQGIQPRHMARGVAAALLSPEIPSIGSEAELRAVLRDIWGPQNDVWAEPLIDLTWQALQEASSEQ